MKNFNALSERETLALAISLEEEDERVYADFAEGLKQDFPASASVFNAMRGDESGHRRRLIELYRQKFGEHIPLIRRQDVKGFVPRKPVWLVRPLGLEAVRRQARAIEVETRRFYERAAMRAQDASVRQLLDDLAQEERTHEDRAQELNQEKLRPTVKEDEDRARRRLFSFADRTTGSCGPHGWLGIDAGPTRLLLQLGTPGMHFLSDWPHRSVQELAWVSPRHSLTTAALRDVATPGSADCLRAADQHPCPEDQGTSQRHLHRGRHDRCLHVTFLLARHLHLSGVIATVAAGLVVGNFAAKAGMSARTPTALRSFWEYVSFIINSLVFLLIGLEVRLGGVLRARKPILIAAAAIFLSRILSVYTLVPFSNLFSKRIPFVWQHVLVWGGLRGALSLAPALSLGRRFPCRDQILTLTFGVVVFSILVQGLSIKPLLRMLRSPLEALHE